MSKTEASKANITEYETLKPNHETKENCFVSNGESYPLCKGNGKNKCHDCCLYEDYEMYHTPY